MQQPPAFGRYQLRRRLATGGMGEVYLAEQTGVGDFRKSLALKLLLPGLDSDEKHVKLFLSEARIASRLTHPNIVQVFDAGRIDGRYFLAMELIDGSTLSDLITSFQRTARKPDVELISHVARQVLEALSYAHGFRDETGAPQPIIHRDISPSNILISKRGEVKLTDFGIAKMRGEESNTAPGEVRGKLAYIAPEVFRGASASVRSDLYAVGVTLYRLAALASPFVSGSGSDPIASIVRGDRVPLSTVRPDLPADVVEPIERAMALEPSERFESALAMREAFPRGNHESRAELLRVMLSDTPPPPPPNLTTNFSLPDLTVATASSASITHPTAETSTRPSWLLAVGALVLLITAALGILLFSHSSEEPALVTTVVEPTLAERPVVTPPASEPPAVEPALVTPPSDSPEEPPAEPPREPSLESPRPALSERPRPRDEKGRPKPGAAAPKAVVPAPKGLASPAFLTVQARPWAHVEMNGKAVGQTPLSRFPVTTPTVQLRFTNPDFPPQVRTLKVTAGEEVKVNVDMGAK